MLVLGIESSCDETGAAIVQDGKTILSNIVSSQIDIHRPYGGVVPELASRKHIETIYHIVGESLHEARVSLDQIGAVAVTKGPGLVGALLVGLSFAKALAYARNLPLLGVSHIEGHLLSIYLEEETPEFPYVALLVSGGHTALYHVSDFLHHSLMGRTRDDAAGEAFDKTAKMLGLGYPGGLTVSRLSRKGNPLRVNFPRALLDKDLYGFSFSGLKTAVANYIRSNINSEDTVPVEDICASFQEAVVDVLVQKTLKAALQQKVNSITVVGGVASNDRLREKLQCEANKEGLRVFIPRPEFCTDNAAMIATAGYHYWRNGQVSGLDLDPISRDRL